MGTATLSDAVWERRSSESFNAFFRPITSRVSLATPHFPACVPTPCQGSFPILFPVILKGAEKAYPGFLVADQTTLPLFSAVRAVTAFSDVTSAFLCLELSLCRRGGRDRPMSVSLPLEALSSKGNNGGQRTNLGEIFEAVGFMLAALLISITLRKGNSHCRPTLNLKMKRRMQGQK